MSIANNTVNSLAQCGTSREAERQLFGWSTTARESGRTIESPETDLPFTDAASGNIARLLGERIRSMETGGGFDSSRKVSSGCQKMDSLLPNSGYRLGSIIEILTESNHPYGGTSIAMRIGREACRDGKYLVLIEPTAGYCPSSIASLGVAIERVIWIRPKTHSDWLWSLDQVARSSAVGAVIASIDRLDGRSARRMQLAIEAGGGLGILQRPISARTEPSWAAVQWKLSAGDSGSDPASVTSTRWFQLELCRNQGGVVGKVIRVGINANGNWVDSSLIDIKKTNERLQYQASHVYLAAELAKPASKRREIAS